MKLVNVILNWGAIALIALVISSIVGAVFAGVAMLFTKSWNWWVFGVPTIIAVILCALIVWVFNGMDDPGERDYD